MADDARCALYGLEDGVFNVTALVNNESGDLKKLVHQEGINSMKYAVLAKDLIVWKVSTLLMSISILQLMAPGSSMNHYSLHTSELRHQTFTICYQVG
jgi:hypothetical protein